ncbi:PHP domain-containing protein [Cryobacterium sp. TMT1-21]|uniref:PHP domain-containing protein n=1 Tax=Cryobacterium shii TaxID=1259235 RepID=A0AAQ2HGD9_9MICO|nr:MULTISPECIES: PHP domain-containing protein [Cryobacterium]TFC51252.1 PHP domain-containing protein [Cryobacterium shii]TFC85237.1 PHP domain-containing protein [Cryobacterium sp. TmT2-59]TFD15815.1 PHP domain-containing protein [Cryobacterium sp. TMT4-10]TFD17078.1 PHP domain-containing protein [Cryobacterium sp. TMT1-21]TFD18176.1 PHP domain-containing protein [Cryobacterium sp. TMT2-23]
MPGERRFRSPIDLHTHSSVSDGTETPSQLVRAAKAAGLGTVALTDHDSTAGWVEAAGAARAEGITLIPGMEFSTRVGFASVHMLAYLFDPSDAGIVAETARVRQARLVRAEQMVERIGADYALTWDDVLEQTTPDATVGRPHIADALVARGFALTRSEAFAGILHWDAGYYQPHYAPEPQRAIALVRAAGGVPVIAHPATRGVDDVIQEANLARLVEAGLFGLELEHRENRPEAKARLYELAEKYGLFVTGSSDYHGEGKPNRLGENTTAPEVLERIIEQATGAEPVYG